MTLREINEGELYLINKDSIHMTYQKMNQGRFGMTIRPDPDNPKQAIMNLKMVTKAESIKEGIYQISLLD